MSHQQPRFDEIIGSNKHLTGLHCEVSNFSIESESKEYAACNFTLNGKKIISREAKITPKKVGQFVTFWKRSEVGPIEPFHENDAFDFFLVQVTNEKNSGIFILPKSILIKHGIISTARKEGKRALRVYPPWDIATNKQAIISQKWQAEFFYSLDKVEDLNTAIEAFQ